MCVIMGYYKPLLYITSMCVIVYVLYIHGL